MSRRIALVGATGRTGGWIARELVRSGESVVLVGRSRAKLDELAATLEGDVQVAVADIEDPGALRRAFDDCGAALSAAGPFADFGRPVAAAAVDAGVHYLDVSGEQRFILDIFARHADASTALIPACGIDSVPGDMLATLAAGGLGAIDRVTVVVEVTGLGVGTGSLLTLMGVAHRQEGLAFRDGELRAAQRSLVGPTWDLLRVKRVRLMRFAAADVVLIPRHVRARTVEAWFTATSSLPRRVPGWVGLGTMSVVEALARSRAYEPMRRWVERLPQPPGDCERVTVEVEVVGEMGTRRAFLTAPGGYYFTAVAAAHAARCAASGSFLGRGPLAPSEAFEAEDFLTGLEPREIVWHADPTPVHDGLGTPNGRLASAG